MRRRGSALLFLEDFMFTLVLRLTIPYFLLSIAIYTLLGLEGGVTLKSA